MKIWKCPNGCPGVRAPSKMRRDDARRYCLVCSAKAGDHRLVARTCPALEAARETRAQSAVVAETKSKERETARAAAEAESERGQLKAFAKRALKLQTFKDGEAWATYGVPKVNFKIRIAGLRGGSLARVEDRDPEGRVTKVEWVETPPSRPLFSSGHAYGLSRFVITAGSDPDDARVAILHEIAHLSAGYKGGAHGDGWRSVYALAVRELTGLSPSGKTKRDLDKSARECLRVWREAGSK